MIVLQGCEASNTTIATTPTTSTIYSGCAKPNKEKEFKNIFVEKVTTKKIYQNARPSTSPLWR